MESDGTVRLPAGAGAESTPCAANAAGVCACALKHGMRNDPPGRKEPAMQRGAVGAEPVCGGGVAAVGVGSGAAGGVGAACVAGRGRRPATHRGSAHYSPGSGTGPRGDRKW